MIGQSAFYHELANPIMEGQNGVRYCACNNMYFHPPHSDVELL